MGTYLLRGITTALLVTVLTLFAGIVWGATGLGGLSVSQLVDIGLLASCLVGGYRTANESGEWWLGGVTGAGYVTVGTLLLALFLPVRGWGFIQILAEGAIIGSVAGAIGVGGAKGVVSGAWQGKQSQSYFKPSYANVGFDDRDSGEFEWDTEKNLQEEGYPPTANWRERSERELPDTRWAKRDSEKEAEVEWSWDSVEDKLISAGSGDSEPLIVWEPERVRSDVIRNNVGRNAVSGNDEDRNEVFEKHGMFYKNEVNRNGTSLRNNNAIIERGTRPWWEE